MPQTKIYDAKTPVITDAINIYCALGWGTPNDYALDTWTKAFQNSKLITAYNGEELVGIIRYLTDGHHDTQIIECAVKPGHQKIGIGSQMIDRLLSLYGHTDIYISATKSSEKLFQSKGLIVQTTPTLMSRKAA